MLASSLGTALLAALLSGTALSSFDRDRIAPNGLFDGVVSAFADDVAPLALGLQARARVVADRPDLAAEALDLWIPLADAAGLRNEQLALEDATFRALHPEAFAALAAHHQPMAPVLDALGGELDQLLALADVEARTQGRIKSLYSTWRKMERKGVGYEQIYDRLALRVITADEASARRMLAALHARYAPIEGEFDDYIASPKPNGYQSLHTAVRTPWGIAEYQLRTEAMHEAAESGDQAHWLYKRSA